MTRSFLRFQPGKILKFIIAMIIVVVLVYPVWWVLCIVFAKTGISVTGQIHIFPTSIIAGVDKIVDIFRTTVIAKAYFNSLAYVFFQVFGVLLLSSMAAFEFSINEFPGKRFLFILALVSLMVPGIVVLIPSILACGKDTLAKYHPGSGCARAGIGFRSVCNDPIHGKSSTRAFRCRSN